VDSEVTDTHPHSLLLVSVVFQGHEEVVGGTGFVEGILTMVWGVPIGAPSADSLRLRARKRNDFQRAFLTPETQTCLNCGAFEFCEDKAKTKKGHNCSRWFLKSTR
jgi:hypothetical protein